jgi:parvulin-like peptidyl-prolyl isomerase
MCRDFLPILTFRRRAAIIHRLMMSALAMLAACGPIALVAQAADSSGSGTKKTAPGALKSNAVQPGAEVKKPELMATINGEEIKRDELGKECLKRYGTEVLDSLVHKEMIADYCRTHNVVVSDKEVDEEIERMAKQFKLPKEQWIKLLEKERGIKPSQYAHDIIWPTLALRKLSAAELTVSKKELDEAYESQFGPGVKARIIVMSNAKDAAKVRAEAVAAPDKFPALARKHSEDSASASTGGLMPPIRHFMGDADFEKAAFSLKVDEISPLVVVGKQYVILKCEGRIEAEPVKIREYADKQIIEALKERKLRKVAKDKFDELEKESQLELIYGNPEKEKANPGVVAVLNGRRIVKRELSEACIERHGTEVLEKLLDHRLLEQAMRKRKLTVTQADLDAEVARAALAMGQKKANGEADVKAWLAMVVKQDQVSIDIYMADAVWPTVALKKIVGDKVPITDEDIKKGYEANYGPRARCRAIVLSSQRKAQEVWDKARDNPSPANFGELAKKFSIDTSSAALMGEVPPIARHGGQPVLEREAFQLKKGELSGVIQVGENFVILLCEGFTEPVKIDMKEAKTYIYEDLHEKKQRMAMAKEFERLQDACEVDNFLAKTLHHPKIKVDPAKVDPDEAYQKAAEKSRGSTLKRQ